VPLEIFLVGPLLALALLALIAVAADLRSHWPDRPTKASPAAPASRDSRASRTSRLARTSRGREVVAGEFGLLRPVALATDLNAARSVRNRLTDLGIRATVGTGRDGLVQVLVFADEYDRARGVV
jgi:hypothetical protein